MIIAQQANRYKKKILILLMRKISFNNIRCKFGQKRNGVQFGGDYILDKIDIHPHKYTVNTVTINSNRDYLKAYSLITKNLHNNQFNINLGGDHSIAVSTIQPLLNKYKNDLLIIWIDAHADINTMKTSLTKNKHGMPVAPLMGFMDHWYDIEPKHYLQPNNLFYFGLRDVDIPEKKVILEQNIHVSECKIPCENYKYASSINNIIHKILLHPARHIHISCDIDGLDPSIMPSTGTTAENGLKLEDVISIINIANKRLVSFDLVEFNPLIGNDDDLELTLNNIKTIISQVIKK